MASALQLFGRLGSARFQEDTRLLQTQAFQKFLRCDIWIAGKTWISEYVSGQFDTEQLRCPSAPPPFYASSRAWGCARRGRDGAPAGLCSHMTTIFICSETLQITYSYPLANVKKREKIISADDGNEIFKVRAKIITRQSRAKFNFLRRHRLISQNSLL